MKASGHKLFLPAACILILLVALPAKAVQIPLPDSDSVTAITRYEEARALAEKGQFLDAVARIQASLNISLSGEMHELSGMNYQLLAGISDQVNDWENTLRYYLKAAAQYDTVRLYENESHILQILGDKYEGFGVNERAADYKKEAYRLLGPERIAGRASLAEQTARNLDLAGEPDSSLVWYRKAAGLYSAVPDRDGLLRTGLGKARVFTGIQEYDSAVNTYLDLGTWLSENGTAGERSGLYNNLGYLWFRQGKYDFARDAFARALSIQENNTDLDCDKPSTLLNLAVCSQNMGFTDEALEYLREAQDQAETCKLWSEKAAAEHALALIYRNLSDPYHAGYYCQECISSAGKGKDSNRQQLCYKTYSEILEEGNDFVKALEYYEKHLNIRDSIMLEEKISLEKTEQMKRSLEATEQQLRLSIADEEVKDLMLKNLRAQAENREKELRLITSERELERSEKNRLQQKIELDREKYNREMREQEVKTLEQDKAIQNLLLIQKDNEEKALQNQNELLKSEKKQQELEAEKEREAKKRARWTAALSILIVFLVLASLISARRRNAILKRQKQLIEEKNFDLAQKNEEIMTQNEQIVLQKSIIEQKNISITDSIQYASRIQQAVLPSREFIGEMGLEHFVFFRPKDIVSGDFYWGEKRASMISFAAVDCTGHGVPGAFMSMLGSAFLNEITSATAISNAADLLNKLREQVIRALKQKGEAGETQDGMDIALCIVDMEKAMLSFSGANNPLYLVRDNELIIYPGDRMPIGIHRSGEKPFNHHEISLKNGDTVYIFSDGFADQFGGESGKKLKYKPFQELLLRISGKPMDVQHRMLAKAFDNWKGNLEQVDDVLVIGVTFSGFPA
ncbi:MAG: SpoIIE family protein phosphatase [Bacteroidota bacterium]